MLEMDLEYNKGVLFARLSGKLTRKSSYKLNNYLVPVILKHKIKYLVYNLFLLFISGLSYIMFIFIGN